MGCPASGKSGLGMFNDSGRNRVPAQSDEFQSKNEKKETGKEGINQTRTKTEKKNPTFGRAADHDHGDDALLRAPHAGRPRSRLRGRSGFVNGGDGCGAVGGGGGGGG